MPSTDAERRRTRVAETRAFFGPRAADWEDRFPDDDPLYAQAVAELAAPTGASRWTPPAAPGERWRPCVPRSDRPGP